MAKVKVLCRIGELDDEHLESLKAVVREAGGTFLRLIDAIRNVQIEAWQAILIGAVGTWIIALIAVGDRLIKPKLRVRKQGFSPNISQHGDVPVRYYLVRASNSRRRIRTAHEVQLIVTRIEKQVGNRRQTVWDEIMPLSWVRQELYTVITRTVGANAVAALFYVQQDGVLGITPAKTAKGKVPGHFPAVHQPPVTLWVTLHATSIETDSSPITLKIKWDGVWDDNKAGLERTCKVRYAIWGW